MGVRGELFSARVRSSNDRRTYFFNLKENRNRDLFLTIVESKKTESGEEHERHQVVLFEEDLYLFQKGLDSVMAFINEHRRESVMGRERPEEPRPRPRSPRGGHSGGDEYRPRGGHSRPPSGDRHEPGRKGRGGDGNRPGDRPQRGRRPGGGGR